jgi:hypothetical protein
MGEIDAGTSPVRLFVQRRFPRYVVGYVGYVDPQAVASVRLLDRDGIVEVACTLAVDRYRGQASEVTPPP